MRSSASLLIAASTALVLFSVAGCGYHTLGAATHLPPNIKTLAVPVFATRTEASGTEQALTEAVIREFTTRTRFRVTSDSSDDSDAVLHWRTILETNKINPGSPTTPATQQSSSFVITIVASGHAHSLMTARRSLPEQQLRLP